MKYDRLEKNYYDSNNGVQLEKMLSVGENILWRGKPKKKAFILNKILPMMPFALLWLAFDSIFIVTSFVADMEIYIRIFMWVFLAFHLSPVWIWISSILTSNRKYKNTEYAFTDRRIIIKSGLVGIDYQTINYKDIISVNLKVGIVDKLLKVGDIYISTTLNDRKTSNAFLDIEDCYEVYTKLQRIVLDIQTDIEYPNALRPEDNPGYNTKYENKDNH